MFGAVTRNGPAVVARFEREVSRAVAAAAHPQVARREAEVQLRRRPEVDAREADVVSGREELRVALLDRDRHRRCDRPGRTGPRVGIGVVREDLLQIREDPGRARRQVVLVRRVVEQRVGLADRGRLREHREQRPVRLRVDQQRRAGSGAAVVLLPRVDHRVALRIGRRARERERRPQRDGDRRAMRPVQAPGS